MITPKIGPIARERRAAIRRRAMKRWLRNNGVSYSKREMYNESALRKLVRKALARLGGDV